MNFFKKSVTTLLFAGFVLGAGFAGVVAQSNKLKTDDEKAVVELVKAIDPAVVSVVISKDLPVVEQYFDEEELFNNFRILTPKSRTVGTQKQEIGGGTAFFITADGLLVTNNHVVSDPAADYTVVTNDGKKYKAQVVTNNSDLDLALIKVEGDGHFPIVRISSSDTIDLGQTVIAIGNALGEFRNTVSKGIISGIGRNVVVDDGQTFSQIIQTDAAINSGNSGGPLLNTSGELIGVNFSTVLGAQSIGFAVPASDVKKLLSDYDSGLLQKNNPRVRQKKTSS